MMRRSFSWIWVWAILLAAVVCIGGGYGAFAQEVSEGNPTINFRVAISFFEAPHQSQPKVEVFGKEAQPLKLKPKLLRIRGLEVKTFKETGPTEMIVKSPECIFDLQSKLINSAGPLTLETADGRLTTEGVGFAWQQTGDTSTLTISNQVKTTIRQDLLTESGSADTNSPSGTNHFIHVQSDNFFFDHNANLIVYKQNVHVDDEQLELSCEALTIKRNAANEIETITAERNVVIINKSTGGRTTGDHAVYSAVDGAQLVTLTGNPHWQDGSSEGTASTFVFDRTRGTFKAAGDGFLKIPRDSVGDAGILLTPQAETTPTSGANTGFVELYGDTIGIQLPPTNGPIQSITADRNVLILDSDRKTRATGDHAFYSKETGKLELSGKAVFAADGRLARGGMLIFDRTNQTFEVLTNAYLKLAQPLALGGLSSGGADSGSNQFIEVFSSSYNYRDNTLAFHGGVKSAFLDGETILGTLDSGALTVGFVSNVFRSIVAEGGVHGRELPTRTESGKTLDKEMECERLELLKRANGTLSDIHASGKVLARQTELRTNSANAVVTTLSSDKLDARFLEITNQIDMATAEGHVVLTRDDTVATGDRAVYRALDDKAVLTGNPKVDARQGWLIAKESIVYDHKTGETRAMGGFELHSRPGAFSKTNAPAEKASRDLPP